MAKKYNVVYGGRADNARIKVADNVAEDDLHDVMNGFLQKIAPNNQLGLYWRGIIESNGGIMYDFGSYTKFFWATPAEETI